jgi:hypothetical protein
MKAIAHGTNLVNVLVNVRMVHRVPVDVDMDQVKPHGHTEIRLILKLVHQNLMKVIEVHVVTIVVRLHPDLALVAIKVAHHVNQDNLLVTKVAIPVQKDNPLVTKVATLVQKENPPVTKVVTLDLKDNLLGTKVVILVKKINLQIMKVKDLAIKAVTIPLKNVILNFIS